jgi:hypothetical protein
MLRCGQMMLGEALLRMEAATAAGMEVDSTAAALARRRVIANFTDVPEVSSSRAGVVWWRCGCGVRVRMRCVGECGVGEGCVIQRRL